MLPIDPATHTLSLDGRYYIYKGCCESSDFSKVYEAVFKQLHMLALVTKRQLFHFGPETVSSV